MTDTVIIRAPDGDEIRWRTQRVVSLGADAKFAATIAESHVDLHDIERLLEAGCPLRRRMDDNPAGERPASGRRRLQLTATRSRARAQRRLDGEGHC